MYLCICVVCVFVSTVSTLSVFLYFYVSIYPCLYFCVRVRVATVEQHSERWFLCQMGEAAGCSWEDSRFQYPSNLAKVEWNCWESVKWEDSWRLDWLTLSRESRWIVRADISVHRIQRKSERSFYFLCHLMPSHAQKLVGT